MAQNEPNNPNANLPFPDLARRQTFIRQFVNGPIESFADSFRNRGNDTYCNSFDIVVDNQYDVMGSGPIDFQNRPIQYLYQSLCNFCTATPPSSKWAVFIEPDNSDYLLTQIGNMKQYEPWGVSQDWDFSNSSRLLMSDANQRRIGCLFVQGATEAGVSIGTANFGGANGAINGFTKGPATQGRADNETVEFVFRETNCSYADFVLRPWVSLVGHKGLHARPQSESIKANITIFELAGTFPDQTPIIRKVVKYYNCAPISVNSETLDYTQDKIINRQASFVYNYFTIQDGTGYGFNNEIERRRGTGAFDEQNTIGDNVFGEVLDEK